MKNNHGIIKRSFLAAFPYTIPILAGFLFLGITYGIYMNVSGFSFVYPMLTSMFVFAGSAEFILVNMLIGAFDPIQTFLMILMINARHLFYGISLLEKYSGTGIRKIYLIFGMCDESFSINCSAEIPEDADKCWFMFFVTILNQTYWVIGATLGGIFGSFINFSTEGLDFAMTAMFVVIFLEQILKEKNHISSAVGIIIPVVSILIFGADKFIIPAMFMIFAALLLLKKPLEKGGAAV